jgi:hypothetical protein
MSRIDFNYFKNRQIENSLFSQPNLIILPLILSSSFSYFVLSGNLHFEIICCLLLYPNANKYHNHKRKKKLKQTISALRVIFFVISFLYSISPEREGKIFWGVNFSFCRPRMDKVFGLFILKRKLFFMINLECVDF